MRSIHRLFVVTLTAALLATACGSGDSPTSSTARTTSTTAETTSTSTTEPGPASGPSDSVASTTTTRAVVRAAGTAVVPVTTTTAKPLSGKVTVFAASSLTDAFDELGRRFHDANPEATATFSYAASGTLATQVNQGAPADVLATADEATMKSATDAGSTATPRRFARNLVEIIVAKGNPKAIKGIHDLVKVSYALCDPSVPCGRYAKLAFEKNGEKPDPKTLELNVKAVVGRVTSGEVDAGVVYRTDVYAARNQTDGVEIEGADDADLQNIYPIALTTRGKDDAVAKAFVAYVLSPEGQAILRSFRFLPAP
jgi:molybdate transport system substrate-binding protein